MTGSPTIYPLHAYIISWQDKGEYADRIAHALLGAADSVNVIYSNHAGTREQGAGHWHQVPDAWFYGPKFGQALSLHREGIMLVIQADASCGDWVRLATVCRHRLSSNPAIGVWCPDASNDFNRLERTLLATLPGNRVAAVTCPSGITWAMTPNIVERMRMLDYSANNLGYGIENAAAVTAYTRNQIVTRELHLPVEHPAGRGYSTKEAIAQRGPFLRQLSLQEQLLLSLLTMREQHNLARLSTSSEGAAELP